MRFRKPELIPLLFIIIATLLLGGLGAWQVVRLQWKESLISSIEVAQAQAALGNLPQSLTGLEYRNVVLTGTFLNDRVLRRVGGKQNEPAGFFILTPFVLEDDGRVILVDRGFARADKDIIPDSTHTVTGILRPLRDKRYFSPENRPVDNLWFYEDHGLMSVAVREELLPLIVQATGKREKDVYPIPNDAKIVLRNDHFIYAITWFSLALIGLVMFGFYYRKKETP